jgi:hypothetical protein
LTSNISAYTTIIEDFHARLPAINDFGGSGYYFMKPSYTSISTFTAGLLFINKTDPAKVAALIDPMVQAAVRLVGNESVQAFSDVLPQTRYFAAQSLPGEDDTQGDIIRIGSRLISHDFLAAPGGPQKLTATFQKFFSPEVGGADITGHIVAGGAARTPVDDAVGPAWRRTVTHLAFGLPWNDTAAPAEVRATEDRVTGQVALFAALEPDMGAYVNEADANEKDFQRSFWGDKYAKLAGIKRKWDPEGLFITRRGVGSEAWDVDGLCRV